MSQKKIGPYHIIELIGDGGHSKVYKASHETDEKLKNIALKVLTPARQQDKGYRARFEQEAKKLEQLGDHPHIIKVLDYYVGGPEFYIVMEFIEGGTLKNYLNEYQELENHLERSEAMRFVQEISDALKYVHSAKIIHRDVKPSNILLKGDDKKAVLTDFGLIKDLSRQEEITSTYGVAGGTAGYAAPEQIKGGEIGEWTDVYALSQVFYAMLTGDLTKPRRPVGDKALSRIRGKIFSPFDSVLQKATAENPDDRYPSIQEFLTALEASNLEVQQVDEQKSKAKEEIDGLLNVAEKALNKETGEDINFELVSVTIGEALSIAEKHNIEYFRISKIQSISNRKQEKYEEALRDARKAYELNTKTRTYLLELLDEIAERYWNDGKFDQAVNLREEAYKKIGSVNLDEGMKYLEHIKKRGEMLAEDDPDRAKYFHKIVDVIQEHENEHLDSEIRDMLEGVCEDLSDFHRKRAYDAMDASTTEELEIAIKEVYYHQQQLTKIGGDDEAAKLKHRITYELEKELYEKKIEEARISLQFYDERPISELSPAYFNLFLTIREACDELDRKFPGSDEIPGSWEKEKEKTIIQEAQKRWEVYRDLIKNSNYSEAREQFMQIKDLIALVPSLPEKLEIDPDKEISNIDQEQGLDKEYQAIKNYIDNKQFDKAKEAIENTFNEAYTLNYRDIAKFLWYAIEGVRHHQLPVEAEYDQLVKLLASIFQSRTQRIDKRLKEFEDVSVLIIDKEEYLKTLKEQLETLNATQGSIDLPTYEQEIATCRNQLKELHEQISRINNLNIRGRISKWQKITKRIKTELELVNPLEHDRKFFTKTAKELHDIEDDEVFTLLFNFNINWQQIEQLESNIAQIEEMMAFQQLRKRNFELIFILILIIGLGIGWIPLILFPQFVTWLSQPFIPAVLMLIILIAFFFFGRLIRKN